MNRITAIVILPAIAALTACGSSEPVDNSQVAEDFAARINGGEPKPTGTVAPTVAEPLEGAAPGPYSPGTATDPESSTCGANLMGPYLGRNADEATRLAIMQAANGSAAEVRFIPAGSPYIRPDPTNPRLNLMLDNLGIIRDARCG